MIPGSDHLCSCCPLVLLPMSMSRISTIDVVGGRWFHMKRPGAHESIVGRTQWTSSIARPFRNSDQLAGRRPLLDSQPKQR